VVVHTDGDRQLAEDLAERLADAAWQLRDRFWESQRVEARIAVHQARTAKKGLILLSDTGDSVYGGAPGDSTVLLQALLNDSTPSPGLELVPMVDADAVRAAHRIGVGGPITLALGAKHDQTFCQPISVTAKIDAVSRGFTIDLLDRGICDLRETALLSLGSIRIALLNHRSFAINHPILYTHLGIDLNDAQSVVLKTASNFQFFSRWRQGLIRVDSPGSTQSNLHGFAWKRLPRPIYPFDPLNR
jgi:microcystin degradation protein MlrC